MDLPKFNNLKMISINTQAGNNENWFLLRDPTDPGKMLEWFEDMRSKSSREINTDSANQTEEHIEKQEKYMDQMDKKKKSVLDQTAKGEKILADPKSPKFLEGHVNKLKTLWLESNKAAEERLAGLKGNKIIFKTNKKIFDLTISVLFERFFYSYLLALHANYTCMFYIVKISFVSKNNVQGYEDVVGFFRCHCIN